MERKTIEKIEETKEHTLVIEGTKRSTGSVSLWKDDR